MTGSGSKNWALAAAAAAAAAAVALTRAVTASPSALAPLDRAWVLSAVRQALRSGRAPLAQDDSAPRALRRPRPTAVSITVFGPRGLSTRATGAGPNGAAAIDDALGRIQKEKLPEVTRVQLELGSDRWKPLSQEMAGRPLWDAVPIGHSAVAAGKPDMPAAIVFPAQWIQGGWAAQNRPLEQLFSEIAGSPPPNALHQPLALWTFATQGFVDSENGLSSWALAFGRPARPNYAPEELGAGAAAAGRWLVRAQLPVGRYRYIYDPLSDSFDDRRYNLPRHGGTTYALLQLFGRMKDPELLEASRRAFAFLRLIMEPGEAPGSVYLRDHDGTATLGSASLALVAYAEYLLGEAQPPERELAEARALAAWVVAMQRPDGSFRTKAGPGSDPQAPDDESYYPGEALFGLLRLQRADPDPERLSAARRGVMHRLTKQRRRPPLYDTWFIHALRELNRIEPDSKLVEHGAFMARRMIDTLQSPQSGRYAPISLGALCSRVEGVVSAAGMAQDSGRAPPRDLTAFLDSAAGTILAAQYGPENSYYLPNPDRAEGGFMGDTYSHAARVDVVHHCLSAQLGISEVLYHQR